MKKQKTLYMTQLAMFSAIIIVMTFVPYLGYITIPGALSITTLHIPVIIGAIALGKRGGTVLGAVWGISCLIYALMNGTADAVIFYNPLISVLPRIIVGFLAALFYQLALKLINRRPAAIGIAAVLGTLSNTILVLTAIELFGKNGFISLTGLVGGIFSTIIAINGVIELVAAIIITIPAGIALLRVKDKQALRI